MVVNKTCPNCKIKNDSTRYFCKECGAFLDNKKFEKNVYEMPQMKIMRIVDNLIHMKPSERVPDEAFALHEEKMERLHAIFALPEFNKNEALETDIKDFLNICCRPEFKIAFVGTIKTGKSTLINSLLGKNYASMAVTPETAALTKFCVSPRDYIEIRFYSKHEWDLLWKSRNNADKFMEEYNELNAENYKQKWVGHKLIRRELTNDELSEELTKWSSSKSPEHFFVKEIEVGISTLPKDFSSQVIFVDTPGLFDPVSYRSQLSIDYIRRANAVFVCVDANKVNQQEIETISTVISVSSNDKEKVYVIATHWDKLNNPEQDWEEQKSWLVRQLTGKGFFATKEIASTNILHTAAYIDILCRNYDSLTDKEIRSLKKFALDYDFDIESFEDRKKMIEKANIAAVYKIIMNKLAGNYHKLLMEEIESKYTGIQHDLRRVAKDMKDDKQKLLNDSMADLKDFEAKEQDMKNKYARIKAVTEQLQVILDQVNEKTDANMKMICSQLKRIAASGNK